MISAQEPATKMTATDSGENPLRSAMRIAMASIVSAAIAPGIYGLLGLAFGNVNREMPPEAIFGPVWLMAAGLTLIAILVIGLPAYIVMRTRQRAFWWSGALVGAMTGALIFVVLGATVLERFSPQTAAALICAGAVVGSLFLWIAGGTRART